MNFTSEIISSLYFNGLMPEAQSLSYPVKYIGFHQIIGFRRINPPRDYPCSTYQYIRDLVIFRKHNTCNDHPASTKAMKRYV